MLNAAKFVTESGSASALRLQSQCGDSNICMVVCTTRWTDCVHYQMDRLWQAGHRTCWDSVLSCLRVCFSCHRSPARRSFGCRLAPPLSLAASGPDFAAEAARRGQRAEQTGLFKGCCPRILERGRRRRRHHLQAGRPWGRAVFC